MWHYYALRWNGEWVHRELPLSDVSIEYALSGPGGLSATIEPSYADMIGPDGNPVLRTWDTVILAEASGQLRGGGIITRLEPEGDTLELECTGFSGYPHGVPIDTSLTWGGPSNGTTGNGVDPAAVVRAIWDRVQAPANGNLGVQVQHITTPYRLGEWHNARRLPTEDQPNPPSTEVEDPPIPIDRVWTPSDRRPAAAKGKTLYWKYELPWHEDIDAGSKIDEICNQVPMDYREVWQWATPGRDAVRMRLEMGYPRLGRRRSDLRFVQGENVLEVVAATDDGADYANHVIAYGAGEGAKQLRESVSVSDGRLRRVATVDAPDVTSRAALRAVALDELHRRQPTMDITGLTVEDHPHAPIGSYGVGDDIYVQGFGGWRDTTLWVRITELDISPETGQTQIKCARSDGFRYTGGGQ